jgi:hypothetical protein
MTDDAVVDGVVRWVRSQNLTPTQHLAVLDDLASGADRCDDCKRFAFTVHDCRGYDHAAQVLCERCAHLCVCGEWTSGTYFMHDDCKASAVVTFQPTATTLTFKYRCDDTWPCILERLTERARRECQHRGVSWTERTRLVVAYADGIVVPIETLLPRYEGVDLTNRTRPHVVVGVVVTTEEGSDDVNDASSSDSLLS